MINKYLFKTLNHQLIIMTNKQAFIRITIKIYKNRLNIYVIDENG